MEQPYQVGLLGGAGQKGGLSYEHAAACRRTRAGALMPRRVRERCQGREARAALCVTEVRAHARSPSRARPARLRPRRASKGACRAMRALRAGPAMLGQRAQRLAAVALASCAVRRSLTEARSALLLAADGTPTRLRSPALCARAGSNVGDSWPILGV